MNENKNGVTGFFKSKGFYIVLIVCVIAAAVSSYLAVETLMDHFVSQGNSTLSDSIMQDENLGTQVDNTQSDIPISQPEEPTEDEEAASSSITTTDDVADEDEPENGNNAEPTTAEVEDEPIVEAAVPEAEIAAEPQAVEPPSFTMPVSGNIINDFSGDELVYNETMNDWRTHNGIDIAAALDTPVMAAIAGEVINLEIDDLWGGVVEIESGDVVVRYVGLDADIPVQKGQQLRSGEIIGKIGEVPSEIADESHIHIEAIKDGEYIPFTDLK